MVVTVVRNQEFTPCPLACVKTQVAVFFRAINLEAGIHPLFHLKKKSIHIISLESRQVLKSVLLLDFSLEPWKWRVTSVLFENGVQRITSSLQPRLTCERSPG